MGVVFILHYFYYCLDELKRYRTRLHTKPVQWQEAYKFLFPKAREWINLAYQLNIDRFWIDELRSTYSLFYDQRFERVVKKYVRFETSPLTWSFIIEFLRDHDEIEQSDKVKEWLKEEECRYPDH